MFRLREILKERKITIGQFADMSGISQSNLSNYMMGKVSPTLETINKIAEALDVDVANLFKKEEDIVLVIKYNGQSIELGKDDLIDFVKSKINGDGNKIDK